MSTSEKWPSVDPPAVQYEIPGRVTPNGDHIQLLAAARELQWPI
jgi:hypothetical protein